MTITPLLLSGGAGTRLWPMSTSDCPKQFLPLTDARTMFELTLERVADGGRFAPPLIVAGADHALLVETQLATTGMSAAAIILEPCPRNTAPAIALAALLSAPDALLLVMPSDHVIRDVEAFCVAVDAAAPIAADGWLVTFGIAPTAPETGYGYIAMGQALGAGVHKVAQFVEKPDRSRAEAMIASGNHAWNGGIFLLRASAYLAALEEFAPAILARCREAVAGVRQEGVRHYPDPQAFAACPSDSIDYAVLERSAKVAVVPADIGWSDVGSWDALYEIGAGDEAGNVIDGRAIVQDGRGNLIRSDGLRVAIAGISDIVVIAHGNDVLIVPRGETQRVKAVAVAAAEQDRQG